MKKIQIIAVLLMGCLSNIFAQGDPKMLDPNIRYGVLENGMTYYILHNEKPKDKASFYIVHNVGAVLEDDDQNGLAHMLEHMAFNGSEHFPGKGVKNFLENQGVSFGSNINAYTNIDETVYNISNVPTVKSEVMDSCLWILHDWSGSLTLAGEEIDAERGVIKEEWRTRMSAGRRFRNKLAPITYYKSKYEFRDVIGDMNVIDNSPYEAIRSFYKKWYRPDLQAVVIVGDFDVDQMEVRAQNILSQIPASQNPAERIEYEIADNDEFLYDYATDAEAQFVQYTMMIKHDAPARMAKGEEYMRNELLDQLYISVMRERLSKIQQKPEAPFLGAWIGAYRFVRKTDVYHVGGTKPDHLEILESMKALLIENERARRFGITSTELERAKANMMTSYEQAVKNSEQVDNDRMASSLKTHYLQGEPKLGASLELDFAKRIMPGITAEEISERVKMWNTKNNMVISIQGPENENLVYPDRTQIAALLDEVSTVDIAPYEDRVVTEPLLPTTPQPGKVVSTKSLDGLAAKELTLSNGAKVVIYPTDKNDNEILFGAYSQGGMSLLSNEELASAEIAAQVADESGIGIHNMEDVRQLLVGKKISIMAQIDQWSEGLSGSTTPTDLETLLQLTYMTFEMPRFEKETFETITAKMKLRIKNADKNPKTTFGDSVQVALAGGRLDRRPLKSIALIEQMDFGKVKSIYQDRIKDAGDFVFVYVGAIDESTFIPMIEKYIGAISDTGRRENWKDDGVRVYGLDGQPYHNTFAREMNTAKQTNYIKFVGKRQYSREEELILSIASGVLRQRYFETIREQEGGSYGVSVRSSFDQTPIAHFDLSMYFDCNPDMADRLVEIIYEQVEDVVNNGAKQEEFSKVVEGMNNNRERYLEQNSIYLSGLMNYYRYGLNTALSENYEDILAGISLKKFNKTIKKVMGESQDISVIMQPIEVQ